MRERRRAHVGATLRLINELRAEVQPLAARVDALSAGRVDGTVKRCRSRHQPV